LPRLDWAQQFDFAGEPCDGSALEIHGRHCRPCRQLTDRFGDK
jgi:hypothetical protein